MFNDNNSKLVLHKLMAEVGKYFVYSTIQKYNGDYRSQRFDTKSHINSAHYLDIRGCRSLREEEIEISANRKSISPINVPLVIRNFQAKALRVITGFSKIFFIIWLTKLRGDMKPLGSLRT